MVQKLLCGYRQQVHTSIRDLDDLVRCHVGAVQRLPQVQRPAIKIAFAHDIP